MANQGLEHHRVAYAFLKVLETRRDIGNASSDGGEALGQSVNVSPGFLILAEIGLGLIHSGTVFVYPCE
jgi:hypothetical protein